jgi:hypothetical protein
MCPADRLRDAVAGGALQNDLHGALEAHPVALRDKDRLHAVFRSHDGPDPLFIVDKGRLLPAPFARLPGRADKPCLGTPHRGDVQDETHVGCQAEPAGMGNALAVEEGHIGFFPQLPEGLQ